MDKLQQAFEIFDSYNQKDPTILRWEGQAYPQEYFLSLKLYEWVLKIEPDASEVLQLASRSQHLGRWEIPREHYPIGREGYLTWRKDLGVYHADKATEILTELGYDGKTIAGVREIILKKKLKVNDGVQTMENALCLVFLQYQYEAFHKKHPDKIVNILRKSLLKMDEIGHQAALSLTYTEMGGQYINEALKLIAKKG